MSAKATIATSPGSCSLFVVDVRFSGNNVTLLVIRCEVKLVVLVLSVVHVVYAMQTLLVQALQQKTASSCLKDVRFFHRWRGEKDASGDLHQEHSKVFSGFTSFCVTCCSNDL